MEYDIAAENIVSAELGQVGLKDENEWLKERLVELTTLKEQERLRRVQVQGELREKEMRVRKLERSRHRLRTQMQVKDGAISSVRTELGIAQARHGEERQQVGGLNQRMKDMQDEIMVLRSAVKTKEAEKDKVWGELIRERTSSSVQAAEISTVQQEVVHYRAIVGRLQQLCERLREAYNAAKRELKEKSAREDDMQSELTQAMVLCEEQRRENQLLGGMMRKQNADAMSVERERDELHDKLVSSEAQMVGQQPVELVSAETHKQEMQELMEQLRKEVQMREKAQADLEDAEQARAEQLVKIVDLRGRVQLLEANVDSLNKLNADLEQQVLHERTRGEHYGSVAVDVTGKQAKAQERLNTLEKDAERKDRMLRELQLEHDDHLRLWAVDRETLRKKEEDISKLQRYFLQVKHMLERKQQLDRERAASPVLVAEREQLERRLDLKQQVLKRPSMGSPAPPDPPPDSDSTPLTDGSCSEESEETDSDTDETEQTSALPRIPPRGYAPHPPSSMRGLGRSGGV